MLMTMVNVRKMRVRMCDGQMDVRMGVRLVTVIRKIVLVLMMLVMSMPVRVRDQFVVVLMFVPLPYMKPDAKRHQCRGNPEGDGRLLRPDQQRNGDAEQRRNREVSARACSSEMTKRDDE